jgi:CRP/FNR family transcriptional regulator, nitrogen oxide reductase regulator
MKPKRSIDRMSRMPEALERRLRQHPVLSQFRQLNWKHLIAGCSLREFRPADAICQEGQPAQHGWLIVEGEVKLVRHTTRGQVLLVDILLRGELFGVVFYRNQPVQPAAAVALKRTRLLQFPLAILMEELEGNPALQTALLQDTCLKLCQSVAMRGLALEELPVRVATILCRLHEKFGPVIPETRSTLAELAGTTTESAIRITRELQAQGILRLERGVIEVLSLDRLHAKSAIVAPHAHPGGVAEARSATNRFSGHQPVVPMQQQQQQHKRRDTV